MIARNGSKTIYQDQEGAQHKRRKLFDRNVTFQVVLGDYTDDKVEAMLENSWPLWTRGSKWTETSSPWPRRAWSGPPRKTIR
ncbi:MAG: hypothetical protein ACLTYN_08110 [Dysosmobacter welbionis]